MNKKIRGLVTLLCILISVDLSALDNRNILTQEIEIKSIERDKMYLFIGSLTQERDKVSSLRDKNIQSQVEKRKLAIDEVRNKYSFQLDELLKNDIYSYAQLKAIAIALIDERVDG